MPFIWKWFLPIGATKLFLSFVPSFVSTPPSAVTLVIDEWLKKLMKIKRRLGRWEAEMWLFLVQKLRMCLFYLWVPSWCITTIRSLSSLLGEHQSYSGFGCRVSFNPKTCSLLTTLGVMQVMENQAGLLHVVFSALVSNPNLVVYLQGNFKEKLEGISKLSSPAPLLPSSFRRLFKWKKKRKKVLAHLRTFLRVLLNWCLFTKDFQFKPDILISTHTLEISDKYTNSKVVNEKHWSLSTWSLKNIQETRGSNVVTGVWDKRDI